VTSFVGNHGLLAVFLLMTVSAVLPAASELTMVYGGAIASGAIAGEIALFGHHFGSGLDAYLAVAVTGIVGNTLGAIIGFYIGVYGGQRLLGRYGRYIHVTPERVERAERWFDRFESVAVPLGFATPLVRSFVAIPAGMFEVPFRRFLPSAIAGIAVFCFAAAGIGWALGASWHGAGKDIDYIDVAVILLLVVAVFARVLHSRRSPKLTRRAPDSAR
jgi:membrane protein DedA with SNARE-associated domain